MIVHDHDAEMSRDRQFDKQHAKNDGFLYNYSLYDRRRRRQIETCTSSTSLLPATYIHSVIAMTAAVLRRLRRLSLTEIMSFFVHSSSRKTPILAHFRS